MYTRILYISGPLRVKDGEFGPFTPYQLERNVRIAQHWAVVGLRAGWMTICPHLNTLGVDGCGVSSEQIIKGDVTLIRRLAPNRDAILMAQGWHDSEGSLIEHEAAKDHGLHVVDVEVFQCRDGCIRRYLELFRQNESKAAEYFESLMATA